MFFTENQVKERERSMNLNTLGWNPAGNRGLSVIRATIILIVHAIDIAIVVFNEPACTRKNAKRSCDLISGNHDVTHVKPALCFLTDLLLLFLCDTSKRRPRSKHTHTHTYTESRVVVETSLIVSSNER